MLSCFLDVLCFLKSCVVVFTFTKAAASSSLSGVASGGKYFHLSILIEVLRLSQTFSMDMSVSQMFCLGERE